MRNRVFRAAALAIGLLGIPALIGQLIAIWPPTEFQLAFLGTEAVVIGIFLAYGIGAWPPEKKASTDVSKFSIKR